MPERAKPMERPPAYDELIANIRKNARERLKVSLHEFNGVDCLSLRVWFDADTAQHRPDQMRPSAKGLTVNVKLLPDLLDALTSARTRAEARGLLPPQSGRGKAA